MTLKAMTWVWDNSPYTLGSRLVHLALADVANDAYDNELWMVAQVIADKCALSKRQVLRILAKMVEDGYLELLEQGGGRGKASRYRLILKRCQDVTVSPEKGCQDVTVSDVKGDIRDIKKVTSVTSAPITNERRTQGARTRVNARSTRADMTGFDEFWTVYPKRNGRRIGRSLCEVRWAKLSLDERRAAWRGAVNYAKDCDGGLTIAKDPDRWLRDRLWEDWQEQVATEEVNFDTQDYYL